MKRAIIIADDSEIIQNIVERALSSQMIVLKASNGKEALDIITNNHEYDIIGMILDLNMPGCDGFTVLDYFKTNNLFEKIPVSTISGDDSKGTIDKVFEYEIVDMLNKPFSKANVQNIVSKMIDIRK